MDLIVTTATTTDTVDLRSNSVMSPGMLKAGLKLAVGTDSRASSPSLSPIDEIRALRRAYPFVAAGRLLSLAWNGTAVGTPWVGCIAPGTAPGDLAAPLNGGGDELRSAASNAMAMGDAGAPSPVLRWLIDAAPRFSWVARARVPEGGA